MAIRYECEQCGSVLKINEERAGKPGKCPKCKTAFTVPLVDEFPDDSVDLSEPEDESAAAAPLPKTGSSSPDDFDVDDFLSNDPGLASKAKPKSSARIKPDIDEDELLSDEPSITTKRKGKSTAKSSSDEGEEENAFQIRRNESKSSGVKKPAPLDLDNDEKSSSAQSRRSPPSSSPASAANLASDLLAKSGKKGKKSAWGEMAEETKSKPESEYDYTDLKDQLKKAVPLALGAIVLCVVLYKTVFSAMGSKTYVPPLGQVTGTVTLNGKPVENAMIWFHPIQAPADKGDKKKRVSSSGGATDAAGHYELRYVGEFTGAVVGECNIAIEAPLRSDIPTKYLGASKSVTKTVTPGKQVIDFDLSQ